MAAPHEDFFKSYPNPVFIETGSCVGQGIMMALLAGYEKIYSIELSQEFHNKCVDRFKETPNVHLLCADSRDVLEELIMSIDTPITFWLDAHFSGGDTAGSDRDFPLLEEIDIIKKHTLNTHTIMIDDIRDWGFTDLLVEKLKEINKDYVIEFSNGWSGLEDILIAKSRVIEL